MRAMAVTAYGRPLEEIQLPDPQLRDGEALLRIETCGVCFSDVKTARGLMPYSAELALPHVPGHEIFGRVEVTQPPGLLEEGTGAVVYHYWPCGTCAACRRGDETLCSRMVGWIGFTHHGGFTERIAVPVDRLVPIPPSVDPIHAAPMSCALGTAYRSVVTRGRAAAGTAAAVIGLGGVGIHAAQVARAAGARTVGFDVHPETLATARSLDLDARRSDDPDAVEDLVSATDEGVDLVVDTVGHDDTLALARRLVRPGGRVVGVGYGPTTALTVPTPSFVLDEVEYLGSRYAHRDDLAKAVTLVARGLVSMVVGLVRPLDAVNDVVEALDGGAVVGRAVLQVADGGAGSPAAGTTSDIVSADR
ncbi:MAG TPA: zinc-binding dehydrogenase [Actinomycetota bacterium]|nr:zinc-binding dehydrogenase [Actinomycetota bacterium]